MTAYHRVFSRLWVNPDFRSRSEDGRHAMVYLLTCPHRNTEGLFRLPIPLAAYDLGWDQDRADRAMVELEGAGFIALDRGADLVWLINAVKWNAPRGPKQIKGAVNVLAEIPFSPLRARYLDRCRSVCPELAAAITEHLRWSETVSEGFPYSFDSSSSFSSSNSTPPTPPPEPDAGPSPADAELVLLADQTIQAATQDPTALADIAQRQQVAEVLAAGHPPSEVLAAGHEASAGRRPLALLRAILKRLATEPPTGRPAANGRGQLDDERQHCPNPDCSGGMVGGLGPDGRPAGVVPCPDCHVLGATA